MVVSAVVSLEESVEAFMVAFVVTTVVEGSGILECFGHRWASGENS